MYKNKKIVAIIPARSSSKRIPKKNIRLLAGKPLIAYSIEAAKNSKYIQAVFVSTEDKKIAKIAKDYGAKVIWRPKELATDTASSDSVLLHFAENVDFDMLVFLQCTSPLTTSKDINGALEMFLSQNYDSVLSVCEDRGGFFCGGFLWSKESKPINYDYRNRPRSQELEKVYRENGAIYIMKKKGLVKYKNRLHGKIGLYVMPKERSYEIDDPEDFEFIEKLIEKGCILTCYHIDISKKIKKIKMILLDVDGIFTDGTVYVDSYGREILKFSRIDGKGIELLREKGFILGVITSEMSKVIDIRMKKLKIAEIYTGVKNKLKIYEKLKNKYNLKDENICFCGDDIQDIPVLKKAGLSICPKNAQEEVKKICDYIINKNGGEGFVRALQRLFYNHL